MSKTSISGGVLTVRVDGESAATTVSHRELSRLRRRDREHAALLNSARALVQIGNVESLLQELVDRAHELINSDLAYLSSYDEGTGNLWVRASRGSASQDLQTLTVPAGYGLAAMVAESHMPQWSNAYSDGPHALHSSVSAAVTAEGIQSLLGVPLLADGKFLGALFAAYRYDHHFDADEIALLTALADHAAVVLDRAQMVTALEDAAIKATQAKESAEAHAQAIERDVSIHETLTHQVLNGESIQTVCTTLTTTLNREVAVTRPDSTYLAGSNNPLWWTAEGSLRQRILVGLQESAGTGRAVEIHEGQLRVAVCTAVAAGAPIITVIADAEDLPTQNELRLIERSSQLIALLVVQEDTQIRAEETLRMELVGDLISGGTSPDVLKRRAQSQDYTLATHYAPVVISVDSKDRRIMRSQLSQAGFSDLVTDSPAGLLMLVPEGSLDHAITWLRRSLSSSTSVASLIVYDSEVEITAIPASVNRINHLVGVLPRLGIKHGLHAALEFMPYLALFGERPQATREFLDKMIGNLLRRDKSKNSNLSRTLLTYLDLNASQVRTAEALHIHVNTVKQRLSAISNILGDDWATTDKAFRLHVALRIHFAAND